MLGRLAQAGLLGLKLVSWFAGQGQNENQNEPKEAKWILCRPSPAEFPTHPCRLRPGPRFPRLRRPVEPRLQGFCGLLRAKAVLTESKGWRAGGLEKLGSARWLQRHAGGFFWVHKHPPPFFSPSIPDLCQIWAGQASSSD